MDASFFLYYHTGCFFHEAPRTPSSGSETDRPVNLRIGTCSWKYESWAGIVYSGSPGTNLLKEYAQRFSTVEVDQWFWSLYPGGNVKMPSPETVREYAASVPESFRFTVKAPNSVTLTHYYSRDKGADLTANPYFLSNTLFAEFLNRLEPLKPFLGPLIFQFEYLNRQKMPSQDEFLNRFGEFIQACPQEYGYAVEIRNPHYLNAAHFSFLAENRLFPVFLQGYYMPSIFGIVESYKNDLKETAVIRLHGPDRKGMEEKTKKIWNRIVEPRDSELDTLAEMIHALSDRNIAVYLNVNNHYEGSAPLTIERIQRRIDSGPIT